MGKSPINGDELGIRCDRLRVCVGNELKVVECLRSNSLKWAVVFLAVIYLTAGVAHGIPNAIANNESLIESKFRRSDSPLLNLSVDNEKWLLIVPPEPVERPLDIEAEQDFEILIFDIKTNAIKKLLKNFTKSETTILKLLGRQGLLSSESILGSPIGYGDRIRVTPTTDYPWSTIVKLRIQFPSGQFRGTGFIIDDYHILTAGHCVYSAVLGEWAESIEVIPAFDDGYMPFYHAWATEMIVKPSWYDYGSSEDDFAIITLDRNIGDFTGWMGLEYALPSDSIYTSYLYTAGYPGDLDGGLNMYYDSDWGTSADEYNHWYYMDTRPGQSGSPVWYYDGPDPYVLSIVAYETPSTDPNYGTRLSEYLFDLINDVIDTDTPPTDYANLIDDGQDFSGFYPAIVVPGVTSFNVWSDIRNIGTEDSGGFLVSYYASTDMEITTSDYFIGGVYVDSISPFDYTVSEWSNIFPNTIPNGTYWVGWMIDFTDVVPELLDEGEGNNIAYKDSYQLSVEVISQASVTVTTDKASYLADEIVTINGTADAGVLIAIYVKNPLATSIYVDTIAADGLGSYSTIFRLPVDAITGNYTVYVSIIGATNSTTFIVGETGSLSIDTTPIKGEVFVDGVSWGVAPQSQDIVVGNYTVTFGDVAGYITPNPVSVIVVAGMTTDITVTYVEIVELAAETSNEQTLDFTGAAETSFVLGETVLISAEVSNVGVESQAMLIIAQLTDPELRVLTPSYISVTLAPGQSLTPSIGFLMPLTGYAAGTWRATIMVFDAWPAQGGVPIGTPVTVTFMVS